MPLKTWAPYDRLLAEDLNSNAQYLAGSGILLPGAWSRTPGAVVAAPAINVYTELKLGAPPAGADPLGFWQSGTGRVKVPTGLAGLYLFTATVHMGAPVGTSSTAAHTAQAQVVGSISPGTPEAVASWARFDTATSLGAAFSLLRMMAVAEEWYVQVNPRGSAGVNGQVAAWAITRLGEGVGAIGA